MPRLNGRAAIMRYLGYNPHNSKRWQRLRLRYASALYFDRDDCRWWALSEDLDRLDRSRCVAGSEPGSASKMPSA
jgi:hypothetical protein